MITGIVDAKDASAKESIPLVTVDFSAYDAWFQQQPTTVKTMLSAQKAKPEAEDVLLIFQESGALSQAIAVVDLQAGMWILAHLPKKLPVATYHLAQEQCAFDLPMAALGWSLAHYQFTRYGKKAQLMASLVVPSELLSELKIQREGVCMVRDMVNTAPIDMGPDALEETVREIASTFKAKVTVVKGEALLEKNYPAIYHVGKAGAREPRLIKLEWGNAKDPLVAIIGKGVCFDTGGLDLKPPSGMRQMKKDMAGSAHAIALTKMLLTAKLPIRIQLYVPAVENNVDAIAYRPGDVITMRDGTTVEVHNTDAEGRLVLADALTAASAEKPEWMINFATLTGAGRVALGTSVSALFSNNDAMAQALLTSAEAAQDLAWQLPLHRPYKTMLKSDVADLTNAASEPYGGAITAALFLEHFVQTDAWAHFDIMAWNTKSEPGRPVGGEAMSLRAAYHFLSQQYGKK